MPTPEPKRRWFRLSPDRFVVGLLFVICLLWLSDRFQWFGVNHHKGWTVLLAVAAVGVAAIVILLWWIAGLIFGWRFQFGIRSLLAFCLASSIAAGWLAVVMRQAEEQRRAVEWIRSLPGAVGDYEVDADGMPIGNVEPLAPRWIRTLLGDDFFAAVVDIYYNGITITAAGLEHIKELAPLRVLNLNGTGVTDAGLEHLKELVQLRELHLFYTNITDVGLEHLKGFTELQRLNLAGTKITDAGLEHLKELAQLRELSLFDTKVTVDGVERLQQALPNCKIYH